MPADTTTTAAPEPKRIGRPSSYRDEYATWCERFAKLGASNEEMASALGIGVSTLQRWLATLDDFREAVKRGREYADATVAEAFYHRAKGYRVKTQKPMVIKDPGGGQRIEIVEYVESYPPDTVAGIFWLKNRRPDLWRDKQDVDVSITGRIGRLPDDERSAKALELLKRLASPAIQPGAVIDVQAEPADGNS